MTKTMSPEKINALLAKARKGSTSGFSISDAEAVYVRLGFDFVKHVEGRVVEAVTVTAPDGAMSVKFRKYSGNRKLFGSDLFNHVWNASWMTPSPAEGAIWYQNPFVEQVKKLASQALGLPTVEEEKEDKKLYGAKVDVTNTGTCAVCFQHHKMERASNGTDVMVRHGYRRPGDGHIFGDCSGWGLQPIERSVDGVTLVKMDLIKKVGLITQHLRRVEGGGEITIDEGLPARPKFVTHKATDESYPRVQQRQIEKLHRALERETARRNAWMALEAAWEQDELPEVRHPKKQKLKLYDLMLKCC